MDMIKIRNFNLTLGGTPLFADFNLSIESGCITGIFGPSGVGKTTLVHLLAGLIVPDEGQVEGIDPSGISCIFQEPRLLPWLTVYDNLDLVLRKSIADSSRRSVLIRHHLKSVGLEGELGKFPDQLSGGMKQRASIARAFTVPSTCLLMDEPFKGLDPKLKQSVMDSFLNLWEETRRTVVFVTHDPAEACRVCDRIHILGGAPANVQDTIEIPSPRRSDLSEHEYLKIQNRLISG